MHETIAVYIDSENVSYKYLKDILNKVKSCGRIIILRVYGDWSQNNMSDWLKCATQYGIMPIQCCRISGKNSCDIKLCVDIMTDLYTVHDISMFYIITTDSDYIHVITELKKQNRKVRCIGNSNANTSLISVCDEYNEISALLHTNTTSTPRVDIKLTKKERTALKRDYISEINILLKYNEEINISIINDTLQRKFNFDYREWDCTKMSEFLMSNYSSHYNVCRGILKKK